MIGASFRRGTDPEILAQFSINEHRSLSLKKFIEHRPEKAILISLLTKIT